MTPTTGQILRVLAEAGHKSIVKPDEFSRLATATIYTTSDTGDAEHAHRASHERADVALRHAWEGIIRSENVGQDLRDLMARVLGVAWGEK